jgi:hypothetical protein
MATKAVSSILSGQNKSAMKKLICVLLLFISAACFSQHQTVTKVVGKVTKKTTGEVLKPGSKILPNEPLVFSTQADMVRLLVSGQGIIVRSPSPKAVKESGGWVETLKTALKINSKEGYLSSRSGNDELIPDALETKKEVNSKNCFAAENKYLFSMPTHNVNGGSKFFLQIELPDKDPIIKPLKTTGDTLFINASDFKTEQEAQKVKYKLGFFDREKNSSESLADIDPYFDNTGEMEAIIKILVAANKQKTKELIQRECYKEVYEALGKPSAINFTEAFNKLYTAPVAKQKKVKQQ